MTGIEDPSTANRGRRAPQSGSGEVTGSGAGAGGAGNPEDFDSDVQAGKGTSQVGKSDGAVKRSPSVAGR